MENIITILYNIENDDYFAVIVNNNKIEHSYSLIGQHSDICNNYIMDSDAANINPTTIELYNQVMGVYKDTHVFVDAMEIKELIN